MANTAAYLHLVLNSHVKHYFNLGKKILKRKLKMSSATTFNGKYSNLLIFDTAFRYLLITKIQISSLCKTIHPAVSHMDSSISELQHIRLLQIHRHQKQ